MRAFYFRRVFLLIAGILFFLCAVNLFILYLEPFFSPNKAYFIYRKKWEMLLDLKAPVDWLILGDSSGGQGVMPDIIGKGVGGVSMNFCTIGTAGIWTDTWMVEFYIDRFGPPKGIILVNAFDSWNYGEDLRVVARIPLNTRILKQFRPSPTIPLNKQVSFFLNRYWPLYSQKASLRELVLYPREVWCDKPDLRKDGFRRVFKPYPQYVESHAAKQLDYIAKTTGNCISEFNTRALRELGKVTSERGVRVFLLSGPVYKGVYDTSSFQLYYSRLIAQLKSITAPYPNMILSMKTPMAFTKDVMENANHLTEPAARIYSEGIVDIIKEEERLLSPRSLSKEV